jgi:hypothetical protein
LEKQTKTEEKKRKKESPFTGQRDGLVKVFAKKKLLICSIFIARKKLSD